MVLFSVAEKHESRRQAYTPNPLPPARPENSTDPPSRPANIINFFNIIVSFLLPADGIRHHHAGIILLFRQRKRHAALLCWSLPQFT